jgi:hypothetical protein
VGRAGLVHDVGQIARARSKIEKSRGENARRARGRSAGGLKSGVWLPLLRQTFTGINSRGRALPVPFLLQSRSFGIAEIR